MPIKNTFNFVNDYKATTPFFSYINQENYFLTFG